mmetsp:Transcript_11171/g.20657  ORF Transcript_11171/g.20657 Transcript_11171/m.20657 type:complete len:326 (+) Transcript_11171:810-1787(+)
MSYNGIVVSFRVCVLYVYSDGAFLVLFSYSIRRSSLMALCSSLLLFLSLHGFLGHGDFQSFGFVRTRLSSILSSKLTLGLLVIKLFAIGFPKNIFHAVIIFVVVSIQFLSQRFQVARAPGTSLDGFDDQKFRFFQFPNASRMMMMVVVVMFGCRRRHGLFGLFLQNGITKGDFIRGPWRRRSRSTTCTRGDHDHTGGGQTGKIPVVDNDSRRCFLIARRRRYFIVRLLQHVLSQIWRRLAVFQDAWVDFLHGRFVFGRAIFGFDNANCRRCRGRRCRWFWQEFPVVVYNMIVFGVYLLVLRQSGPFAGMRWRNGTCGRHDATAIS